jgi:hypothetical protein
MFMKNKEQGLQVGATRTKSYINKHAYHKHNQVYAFKEFKDA